MIRESQELAERREWIAALCSREQLPAAYADAVPAVVVPLAEKIAALHAEESRPIIVGISGAQGSGKSTLALFLAECLRRESGLTTACLSLDDLYLCKADRDRLARDVHPLLATRGVPGTHDVALGMHVLATLTDRRQTIALPAFDKARDDRLPAAEWPQVAAPVDVVLFEGWCVGARPQGNDELAIPVNALEAEADGQGIWRKYVNAHLQSDYAELFKKLDALVMLRVPSFDKVFVWRRLQERKLREKLRVDEGVAKPPAGQSDAELERFIMHYERLTRHLLQTMPDYADVVIDVDDEHRMAGILCRL